MEVQSAVIFSDWRSIAGNLPSKSIKRTWVVFCVVVRSMRRPPPNEKAKRMCLQSYESFALGKSLGFCSSAGLNLQSCYCKENGFGAMLERLVSHMKKLFHSFHMTFTISSV